MYKLSKDVDNVNTYRPDRILRTAPKVKMKIDFTNKERVRNSPYYLCNRLWNGLYSEVQTAGNMFEFVRKLRLLELSTL